MDWEAARSAICLEPDSYRHAPQLDQLLVDADSFCIEVSKHKIQFYFPIRKLFSE